MTRLAPAANDAEARKAKFEKLYLLWLKPTKTKKFRQADDVDVGNWLLQFDATVKSLASGACGLELDAQPLESHEFGRLLKHKLSFTAEQEISQALDSINKTWANATVEEIRTAMKQLYQKK